MSAHTHMNAAEKYSPIILKNDVEIELFNLFGY
jgi:hypothetical protein